MPKHAYRIGFDVPFEPFGCLDGDRPSGLLVELVGALLDRAGLAHSFVAMSLAETESALQSGAVDGLAYKGVIPERLDRMRFSSTLLVSGAALFARAGQPIGADLGAYHGRAVVTPRKGPLWSQIERDHPAIQRIDGDSYEGSFALLMAGQADAAALNLHAGIAIAQRLHPGRIALPAGPYAPLPIAFAIAKQGPDELLAAIDHALPLAHADGSYRRIHDRWIAAT